MMQNNRRALIIIRHGESLYNVTDNLGRAKGQDRLDYKFSPELVDAGMSEKGFQQCEEAREKLTKMDIKLVLTSPLKRCLQTTRALFQDHPNHPKVEVWPLLREAFCSSCDLPSDIRNMVKEFNEFDYTNIKKNGEVDDFWFLESLENKNDKESVREELCGAFSDENDRKNNFVSYVVKRMKDKYPHFWENGLEVKARTEKVKEKLKETLKQFNENETIAIVAHSAFLRRFTGKQFDENGETIDGLRLNNCEIVEFFMDI